MNAGLHGIAQGAVDRLMALDQAFALKTLADHQRFEMIAAAGKIAHLDQGVCITSHASQCRTVRQIVALVPIQSLAQMDSKAFYVLASRATHRAVFYTDCKDALKEAVIRPGDRETVRDYEKDHLHPQARLSKALIDLHPGKRVKHIAIANLEAARAYKHQQPVQEMEVQR